jgi:hypothetical protein
MDMEGFEPPMYEDAWATTKCNTVLPHTHVDDWYVIRKARGVRLQACIVFKNNRDYTVQCMISRFR